MDKKKLLIEVLDRGILDLNEFGILTGILTGVSKADNDVCGCRGDCGCKDVCGGIEGIEGEVINPGEYRSKELIKAMEKIIAAFNQK